MPRLGGVLAALAAHGAVLAAIWLGTGGAQAPAGAPERVSQPVMVSLLPAPAAAPQPAGPAAPRLAATPPAAGLALRLRVPSPTPPAGRTGGPAPQPAPTPGRPAPAEPVAVAVDHGPAVAPVDAARTGAERMGTAASADALASTVGPASGHQAPRVLPGNPLPAYPEAAREDGLEGKVGLAVEIDARGQVTAVRWEARSGVMLLDVAARDAVRRWRFEPARRDGQPVAGTLSMTLQFRLDGPVRWAAQVPAEAR